MSRLYKLYKKTLFHLLQAHRHNRLVLEHLDGVPLVILPQVMNPRVFRTGEFLARSLSPDLVPAGSSVLDMGAGAGVAALFTAKWASRVVAIDLNPEAVRCTRINAILNHLEHKIEVRHGDLFGPVGDEKFDRIIFNPPFLKGKPDTLFDHALFGFETLETFFDQAARFLNDRGEILLVLSTMADVKHILTTAGENSFEAILIADKHYINETLLLYRLVADRC